VGHLEGQGERLFDLICERDLEGIVAKHRCSRHVEAADNPPWIKIQNRNYSQMVGRDELFARSYEARGVPKIGWDVCATAATNAE
jgi:ATP-dependent DNA ligase